MSGTVTVTTARNTFDAAITQYNGLLKKVNDAETITDMENALNAMNTAGNFGLTIT